MKECNECDEECLNNISTLLYAIREKVNKALNAASLAENHVISESRYINRRKKLRIYADYLMDLAEAIEDISGVLEDFDFDIDDFQKDYPPKDYVPRVFWVSRMGKFVDKKKKYEG